MPAPSRRCRACSKSGRACTWTTALQAKQNTDLIPAGVSHIHANRVSTMHD